MILQRLPTDIIIEICRHLHMNDISSLYYTTSSLQKMIIFNQSYLYSICQTLQPHGMINEWWDVEETILKNETSYLNGKEDGEYKSLSVYGRLLECGSYSNGLKNGEWKEWYINGKIYQRCFYSNGNLNGEYNSWYENGALRYKEYYKDGKLHGCSKDWYYTGQLSKHEVYENGEKSITII